MGASPGEGGEGRPRHLDLLAAASLAGMILGFGDASAQDAPRSEDPTCAGLSPPAVSARPGGVPGARIAGKVVDAASREPLGGLLVRLGPGPGMRAVTDDRGRFRLAEVAPGAHPLEVGGVGYGERSSCVAIPPDRSVDLVIALRRHPIPLQPLDVTVEKVRPLWLVRAGFYRRMRAGGGVFITEEEIREQDPERLSEMFRGEAAVSVANGNPRPMQALESTHPPPGVPGRRRPQDTGTCPIQFLVDGRAVPLVHGVDTFHPRDVAAVEAYFSAAQVPPQFNVGRAACGVVNVWLKIHPDGAG